MRLLILLYKNTDAEVKNMKGSLNICVLYTGITESRIWPTERFTCTGPEYMHNTEIRRGQSLIAVMI